jgi:hypothetical protein
VNLNPHEHPQIVPQKRDEDFTKEIVTVQVDFNNLTSRILTPHALEEN